MINASEWFDVTSPIFTGMTHWPGDPSISMERVKEKQEGDMANVSLLKMGTHTGTHMDAPLHFIQGAKDISQIPIDFMVGRGLVITIKDPEKIRLAEIKDAGITEGMHVLFKTSNSAKDWTKKYMDDYVYMSREVANYLKEKKIKVVGVDYLSVGKEHNDVEVHLTLLGSGIWIIEGLRLQEVPSGEYDIFCLPLKLLNGDGAPARVLLKKRSN